MLSAFALAVLLAQPIPSAGVVVLAGGYDAYWEHPTVIVEGDNHVNSSWRSEVVTVRFAGLAGDWHADDLIAGDRVEVPGQYAYHDTPVTLTVTTPRDPDFRCRIATERSVVRFQARPWPPPPGVVPAARVAMLGRMGSPVYRIREAASRSVVASGGAYLRALCYAERSPDPEVRWRAAVAIGKVLRGDTRW